MLNQNYNKVEGLNLFIAMRYELIASLCRYAWKNDRLDKEFT